MEQAPVNLAGPVKVLSESFFPADVQRHLPAAGRSARRCSRSAAGPPSRRCRLRNPMHNSHAYLAWVAIEVCDGVYIHQLVGKLKPGDIPADVRVQGHRRAGQQVLPQGTRDPGRLPMEMRYAGPREALLHAVFRQNYGCSHLIVGRDHAGVGNYYGPFDAQTIFHEVPADALAIQPAVHGLDVLLLRVQEHGLDEDLPAREQGRHRRATGNYKGGARLLLSGTLLRKLMSEGKPVPAGVLEAGSDCDSEGVLRQPRGKGGGETPQRRHRRGAEGVGATGVGARHRPAPTPTLEVVSFEF